MTPGTVSKVLNNYPDISDATRQNILKIIEENQYTPRNSARSLKLTSKIPQIGLGMEGICDWLHQSIARALSIRLHNADYTILTFNDNYYTQDKTEKFQELLSYIDRHELTGMVYFGGEFKSVPAKYFQSLPCPVIFVNTVLPDQISTETYSSVQVDHYGTAAKQMEYLISKGHRNICTLITSEVDTSVYGLRRDAYRDVLRQRGLEHNLSHVIESHYICDHAFPALSAHLKAHPEITAICSAADVATPAAVRAVHNVGRTLGKDMAIISFDGMIPLQYSVPSITIFEQPWEEMTNYVYELLIGLIDESRQHLQITFQAKFQENESCPPCAPLAQGQ